VACLCFLLVTAAFAQAHAPEQQYQKLLRELQDQSNRLRAIERLLQKREAQLAAQQISREGAAGQPVQQQGQAQGLQHQAVDYSHWLNALKQACRTQDKNGFQSLSARTPDAMALLKALQECQVFEPELRSLLAQSLQRQDAVANIMAWLMIEPSVAVINIVVDEVAQQKKMPELVRQLHDPIRLGQLDVSRAHRTAAYYISQHKKVARVDRRLMLSDLQRLLVYGEDRVFTHQLLASYYQRFSDHRKDWQQLVSQAWYQASLNRVQSRDYAPLAAREGVAGALMYWFKQSQSEGQSLSSLKQLVELPSGMDISVFLQNAQGSLDFDPKLRRYRLEK